MCIGIYKYIHDTTNYYVLIVQEARYAQEGDNIIVCHMGCIYSASCSCWGTWRCTPPRITRKNRRWSLRSPWKKTLKQSKESWNDLGMNLQMAVLQNSWSRFSKKKNNQSWRVNSGLFLLVRIYAWLLELMAMRLEAQLCQIWPVASNVVLHNRPPQTIPVGDEWRHPGDVRSMQEGFCCASLQSSVPYWRRSCWKILHPKSSQYQELTSEQRKETKHATKRQTLLGPIWLPPLVFFGCFLLSDGKAMFSSLESLAEAPCRGWVPHKCQRLDITSNKGG